MEKSKQNIDKLVFETGLVLTVSSGLVGLVLGFNSLFVNNRNQEVTYNKEPLYFDYDNPFPSNDNNLEKAIKEIQESYDKIKVEDIKRFIPINCFDIHPFISSRKDMFSHCFKDSTFPIDNKDRERVYWLDVKSFGGLEPRLIGGYIYENCPVLLFENKKDPTKIDEVYLDKENNICSIYRTKARYFDGKVNLIKGEKIRTGSKRVETKKIYYFDDKGIGMPGTMIFLEGIYEPRIDYIRIFGNKWENVYGIQEDPKIQSFDEYKKLINKLLRESELEEILKNISAPQSL